MQGCLWDLWWTKESLLHVIPSAFFFPSSVIPSKLHIHIPSSTVYVT